MSTSPVTVLNVEDDAGLRFVRSAVLSRAGYHPLDVDCAAEARAAFAVQRPPVVLLDIHLPDGDGFSLCEEFKHQHPESRVILITAVYRSMEANRDGFALGADAFLVEPLSADQLLRVVAVLSRGEQADDPDQTWIVTTTDGRIVDLSADAAARLNFSRRGSIGRSLLTFFPRDWEALQAATSRACAGAIVNLTCELRPRERKPARVSLEVAWSDHTTTAGAASLRWTLRDQPALDIQ